VKSIGGIYIENWYRSYLLTIFTTFYAHKKELLIIHKNGLSHLLLDVLDQCFKFDAFQGKIGSAQPFKAAYHIGGIYHNLLLWMNHGMQETPKQMCSIAPVLYARSFLYAAQRPIMQTRCA
jgi:hypothetical protein